MVKDQIITTDEMLKDIKLKEGYTLVEIRTGNHSTKDKPFLVLEKELTDEELKKPMEAYASPVEQVSVASETPAETVLPPATPERTVKVAKRKKK